MDAALNTLAAITYPEISPIAFSLGPLAVRWYGLAYVAGILLGWFYARRLAARNELWAGNNSPISQQQLDDFVFYAAIGIVAGGRIGYVIFYEPDRFIQNPLWLFAVNQGGMSFHGGFLGTTIAMLLFARRHKIAIWSLFDIIAAQAPIGFFFVRLTNFINGELWGRISDVPWAMVFPTGGPFTRHPSQLYEAGLEGITLFIILATCIFFGKFLKKPGFVTGVFVTGYASFRIFIEFFREPDQQLGFLFGGWLTMGMLLSLPMLAAGLWALVRAHKAASSE